MNRDGTQIFCIKRAILSVLQETKSSDRIGFADEQVLFFAHGGGGLFQRHPRVIAIVKKVSYSERLRPAGPISRRLR